MRTSRRGFVVSTLVGTALGGVARSSFAATSYQRSMGPEETAILLAQFESAGDLTSLLTYLHKDAAAIIPDAAIVGWYRNEWFPSGPGPITPYDVTTYNWTWEVNGVTYPNTAEVAFTQSFDNGSVANDVVRLVQYDGVWHWFFGRNREFVNEQIANYAPGSPFVTAESARAAASSHSSGNAGKASSSGSTQASGGKAPYGVAALAGLSADDYLALAPQEAGGIARTDLAPERSYQSNDGRATYRTITYYNTPIKKSELYPVGVVGTITLSHAGDELAYLEEMKKPVMWEGGVVKAPDILQAGSENGVRYQMLYENGSAAVGNVVNLYFTKPGNNLIYVVGSTDSNGPSALAEAMVAKAGRSGA